MGASKLCETCKTVHWPIAVYRKWIRLYPATSGKPGEQFLRWQAIVDKHSRKKAV